MTREEAIQHARFVREKTRNASIICLDGEVIDAILGSPWRSAKDEKPEEGKWLIWNTPIDKESRRIMAGKRVGDEFWSGGCVYQFHTGYWMYIPEKEEEIKVND